eukprot:TRINITY_DN1139_c0_g1_i1.p2 TRINITY_DN1139_c0_g1~~TRINITY_DN1139_c0_g1_i1.p2  ORF type:complete len:279 (-),score=21.26 TRINITY_DN1139_c0_g1_i1:405-1145(-)
MFFKRRTFTENQSPNTQEELDAVERLVYNNKKWAAEKVQQDPKYFQKFEDGQEPEFLWLGCSDSRVVVDQLLGTGPGEVFVHRNVGNIVYHNDMNCMSVVEFAVTALKVKHIIVCGHYGCGAVKASLTLPQSSPGVVNTWINEIRSSRNEHAEDLKDLSDVEKLARMCEYNVVRQTYNVATSPAVQSAWARNQDLTVHGMIYQLKDGLLKRICGPISSNDFEEVAKEDGLTKTLVGKLDKHISFET